MPDLTDPVEERLARFRAERLLPALYRERVPLEVTAWEVPGEPVPFDEAVAADFSPVRGRGRRTGRRGARPGSARRARSRTAGTTSRARPSRWSSTWGSASPSRASRPRAWSGRRTGRILKAVEPRNQAVPLARPPRRARARRSRSCVEAASNPHVLEQMSFSPTHLGDPATAGKDPLYRLRRLELGLRDVAVWELDQDLFTLAGLLLELPANTQRRAEVREALDRVGRRRRPAGRRRHRGGRARAAAYGARQARERQRPPALRRRARPHRLGLAVAGARDRAQGRADVRERLRPHRARGAVRLRRVVGAAVRLAAGVLPRPVRAGARARAGGPVRPGRRHVGRVRHQPARRRGARAAVRAGQGLLLRRARRGHRRRSGCRTPSATPARCRRSWPRPGAKWFLTQKISWNDSNVMPHSTFRWEGIDGTQVFTHFPPVDTYNSDLSAADLARAERNFTEKAVANRSLVPFGHGDGGGGPTREMVAAARRTASLEGSPAVRLASPVEFFTDAQAELPDAAGLVGRAVPGVPPRHLHQSRPGPSAATGAASTCCARPSCGRRPPPCGPGRRTRTRPCEAAWRTVCLQQFHDILPGTSISWVYQDAEAGYARVAEATGRVDRRRAPGAARHRHARRRARTPARTRWTASRRSR